MNLNRIRNLPLGSHTWKENLKPYLVESITEPQAPVSKKKKAHSQTKNYGPELKQFRPARCFASHSQERASGTGAAAQTSNHNDSET